MHSYQSRWEELPTNQQGQVMTNFKPGDWVIIPNDSDKRSLAQVKETYTESSKVKLYWPSEDSAAVCSEMTHYELWQPQSGEWCWFWSKSFPKPQLLPFRSYFKNSFYSTEYGVTIFNEVLCECNYFDYCEPFIGQLPTILKDK